MPASEGKIVVEDEISDNRGFYADSGSKCQWQPHELPQNPEQPFIYQNTASTNQTELAKSNQLTLPFHQALYMF
jgi:hypothetical protein